MRLLRRVGGGTIFNNPIALAIIGVCILVGVAIIIWENVKESQAAEKERSQDRQRPDSIWKD